MKKILIVEDDRLSLELLAQLLNDDYELYTAMDGDTGMRAVKKIKPDLLLLDISLPVMDGYEIAQKIKADPELKNVVVVGVSSRAMKADVEKAMRIGFDDYLTKPLDEKRLFKMLDRYLEGGKPHA